MSKIPRCSRFSVMRGAFAGTAAAFGIYSAVLAGFVAALFGSTAI
ncbi:MAG: hypothetical protein RLZ44_1103 [Pseudomonadota bacterium]